MADMQSRWVLNADTGQYEAAVRDAAAQTDNLGRKQIGAGKSAEKSSKSFDQFAKQLRGGVNVAAKWTAGIAAAGAAMTAAFVKTGLNSVDSLAKVSSKLGIATDQLAKLRFAAEQTGVSSNTLDMALQRMTRRVAEAGQGTGEAVKALQELGLNAQELARQSPDEVFRKVAGAMEGVDNQSDKLRLAFKLFDSEGAALVNTLAAGEAGLNQFGREAEAAGLAIDGKMAAKVEAANDAINRVSKVTEGFSQQLAIKLAPALTAIADYFFQAGTEGDRMGKVVDGVFKFMIKGADVVAGAIRAIQLSFQGIKGVAQVAVRGLTFVWQQMIDFIVGKWNWLAERVPFLNPVEMERVIGGVGDAMESEISATVDEINRLLEKPLPSAAYEEYARKAEESADRARRAVDNISGAFISNSEDAGFWAQDVTFAIDGVAEVAEKATTQVEESTAEVSTFVTRGFERMRDAVGDFFTNMLLDGKASFDDLLDMFKRVIAEMIATAASNRIMVALGLSAGSSAASAAGSAGSIGSILSGGAAGGLSSIFGAFSGGSIGSQFMSGIGSNLVGTGDSILSAFGVGSSGAGTSMLVGGAATLGAGALGGWAGTALGENLFGRSANSSWGAAAGTAAGAAIGGPIGAAIGGAIGGALDAAFGSSNSDKWVNYQFANGTSTLTRDTGKPLSQDAAEAGVGIVQSIADALGGSNASFEISGGRRSGLRINGQVFGDDAEGFAREAFDLLLEGADQFSDEVKRIARAFRGSAEDAVTFTMAWDGIEKLLDSGSAVDAAIADFDRLQDAANTTFMDSYRNVADATLELARNYDGTATSAANLAQGLQTSQVAAYEMSMAILQLNEQLQKNATDSAQRIRESVMSEEELRSSRLDQRTRLFVALGEATDPARIQELANEILKINEQVFNSLSAEDQNRFADAYADFAERTGTLAEERTGVALDEVRSTQEEITVRVGAILEGAAGQQQTAADTMVTAAGIFERVINELQRNGINISVEQTTGMVEVTS